MSYNSNNPYSQEKLKNFNMTTNKPGFYNTLNYNNRFILKFLKDKVEIFKKIFFLEQNFESKDFVINELKNHSKMDIDYDDKTINDKKVKETQVGRKNNMDEYFQKFVQVGLKNNDLVNDNYKNPISKEILLQEKNDRIKIEIISVISFLIGTYKNSDSISSDINKFIIDLIDIFALSKENDNVLHEISNLSRSFFLLFILFMNLTKFI